MNVQLKRTKVDLEYEEERRQTDKANKVKWESKYGKISFYTERPSGELTLVDFEQLGSDRLSGV